MSRASGAYARPFIYQVPNCRAVADIQKNIIKRGKRNGVSRMLHAKNDKETIATWRLELNRILQVFSVRSITVPWPPLTDPFQTELALNTSVAVSDIHRILVGGEGGTDGKNPLVSVILL